MKKIIHGAHLIALSISASAVGASFATVDLPLAVFGVSLSVLLAGFAGSVCALSFLPPIDGRIRMFGVVIIGTLVAAYGVRILGKVMGWGDDHFAPGAFFVGLLSHLVLTWVFARLPALADKRFGGGS